MLFLSARAGSVLLLISLAALITDALIGDPPWLWRFLPHPVALIGGAIAFLDKKLNRVRFSGRTRFLLGLLVAIALLSLSSLVGLLITKLRLTWRWGWAVELALVWMLLAQRSLFDHVRNVAKTLRRDGLQAGRREISKIVGRDPASLDEHAVARAAIESCAESFADGVVAPLFWYLLLGLPGMLAYKTANTMDSMIGHRSIHYIDFGKAAARLDDLMTWIPARLAGLLLCLAAIFSPHGRPIKALVTMWRDHAAHDSPNAGWPEAAMAGALDLALAGPRRYGGELVSEAWIGKGRAKATISDVSSALYLFCVACLIEAGFVVLLLVLRTWQPF